MDMGKNRRRQQLASTARPKPSPAPTGEAGPDTHLAGPTAPVLVSHRLQRR